MTLFFVCLAKMRQKREFCIARSVHFARLFSQTNAKTVKSRYKYQYMEINNGFMRIARKKLIKKSKKFIYPLALFLPLVYNKNTKVVKSGGEMLSSGEKWWREEHLPRFFTIKPHIRRRKRRNFIQTLNSIQSKGGACDAGCI